jgi:hypothetical protein
MPKKNKRKGNMTQVEGKKMGGGAAMPSEPLCQSKNY